MSLNKANSKMITVRNRGFVTTSRGRIMGPIRTPYREAIDRIWSMMLDERADIYERLNDGSDLKLTTQNYDTDNNAPVTTPPIPNLPPVDSDLVEEPKPTKKEEPVTKEADTSSEKTKEESVKDDYRYIMTPNEEDTVEKESTEENTSDETTEEDTKKENDTSNRSGKNNKHNRRGKNKKQAEPTPEEKKVSSAALEVPVEEA